MINILKTIYSKISNCCLKIINWIPDFDYDEDDEYDDDEY
jgi:hypothetical protein